MGFILRTPYKGKLTHPSTTIISVKLSTVQHDCSNTGTLEHAPVSIHTDQDISYPRTISAMILSGVYIWTKLRSVGVLRTTWYMQSSLEYSSPSTCHIQRLEAPLISFIADEIWNSWPFLCGICPPYSVHKIPTMPPKRPK